MPTASVAPCPSARSSKAVFVDGCCANHVRTFAQPVFFQDVLIDYKGRGCVARSVNCSLVWQNRDTEPCTDANKTKHFTYIILHHTYIKTGSISKLFRYIF